MTMAEASAVEWSTIEKAVRTVLPAKLPFVKNHSKDIGSRERHAVATT